MIFIHNLRLHFLFRLILWVRKYLDLILALFQLLFLAIVAAAVATARECFVGAAPVLKEGRVAPAATQEGKVSV